jgi:asparagine synthase (glutamine-hydrolysing)
MSAVTGIWYWDERPVRETEIADLAECSRAEGPDGSASLSPAPGLVLQAHMLHFDRLSALERQPYAVADGSVVTWDGRLDNREDLLIALNHDLGEDRTDVALVAAAYTKWGLDCLPRLLGDWSLALWDRARQTLVLARDYMGNRPLYYRETREGVAWASSLDALATCFNLYGQLNDVYIAGKLKGQLLPHGLTPFDCVHGLRPGHVLQASREHGVRNHRYWFYEPTTLRYRDPRSYGDHLRALLTESVRVRLRARGRVWSQLSGGWDSSSVVCLAHSLVQGGTVEAATIQPISGVSSGSPESDESSFIGAVERWCGLKSERWEYPGSPTIADLQGLRHPSLQPPHLDINDLVRRAGDRIVLTGMAGDLIMCRGSLARMATLLDPLLHGRILQFLRLMYLHSQENRRPFFNTLAHLTAQASLPPSWYDTLIRQPLLTSRGRKSSRQATWPKGAGLTSATIARAPEPPSRTGPSSAGFPVVKRRLVEALYRVADTIGRHGDRSPRIWQTHPYLHRPLVMFVLATPPDTFWDPRVTRAGMQRALVDVLPPEILTRASKGDPEAVLTRARRDWHEQLPATLAILGEPSEWRLVKGGYLESAVIHQTYNHPELKGSPIDHWIRIEIWLRTMESLGRQLTARPHGQSPTVSASPLIRHQLATP